MYLIMLSGKYELLQMQKYKLVKITELRTIT